MTYPLAYSTLGCPEWPFEHAVAQAAENGFQALEVRIYNGEVIQPDLPAEERQKIRDILAQHDMKIVALGLSTRFNTTDQSVRQDNVHQLRQFIELAADLNAPMVRTFGGEPDMSAIIDDVVRWTAEALNECADFAQQHGVTIVLETHDSFSRSEVVARTLNQVQHDAVGAVWDVHHPYRMGDTIDEVWANIGPRVKHIHMKDAQRRGDGSWQLVPLGEGEVPCRNILQRLYAEGYEGYICAEWEKKWHPEIAEPEIAMPQHAETLRRWMAELEQAQAKG